jgi:cell division protein FtsA
VPQKESVDMKKFAEDAKGSVSRKFIAEIVESRLEEIFDLVNNELKLMEKYGQLPGGVVLVGGGAKLPGLTDLVKQEMKLAAQIGFTLADEWEGRGGGFKEYLEDPEFVGAFGLVLWGMDSEGKGGDKAPSGAGLKKFFRYFAP